VRATVSEDWSAVDPPREAPARALAAGLVLHPQRTTAHGAARLQPAVSLVRRAEYGRRDLGCHGVHEEPRAVAAGAMWRGHSSSAWWPRRAPGTCCPPSTSPSMAR